MGNMGDFGAMGVCPKCKGCGYIIVRKTTPRSIEIYGKDHPVDYAEPCPYCNGGEQKQIEDVRTRANIPTTYYDASIESFKFNEYYNDKGEKEDISLQEKYVRSFIFDFEKWQKKGIGLYIYSKRRGTGKTFLASCICNSLMAKYKLTTKFVSTSDLLDIAKAEPRQGEKAPLEVLCECKVLVLDDIGQKNTGTEWLNDILFKIIDARYQKKLVTIFTSNVKVGELNIDDRVRSRIDKLSQLIPLPEYSFRNKEAHEEKLELFKEIGLM
jgi:DNA replication protein DnaC